MAPVIPVIVVDDLAHARPLAEALVAGGLPVLEVTLRTDCALAGDCRHGRGAGRGGGRGHGVDPAHMKAAKTRARHLRSLPVRRPR